MGCTPAAACRAVLLQATARWPGRSKISDGICPSAAHTAANPTSDHELGNAVDLTHDPAHGCDAHAWARQLVARRDSRVKYVISNGAIAASYPAAGKPAWTWRPYDGSNPHTKHAHVSIWSTARGDTRPWFDPPAQPNPTTRPAELEEDDMALTDAQAAQLVANSEAQKNWTERIAGLLGEINDNLKALRPQP